MLEDAKQGIINTILVKDMSRFGRNYIMVGQYLDYVFPTFGIRFVALSDNIDTENNKFSTYALLYAKQNNYDFNEDEFLHNIFGNFQESDFIW